MSQLWTDERILSEIPEMTTQSRCYPAVFAIMTVMKKMRAEYEALIERMNDQMTQLAEVQEDRIAELEARLSTMSELEEQHLREIDSLERQLRDTQIGVRKLVGLQP